MITEKDREEIWYRLLEFYINYRPSDNRLWLTEDLYCVLWPEYKDYTKKVNWKCPFCDLKVGISRAVNDSPDWEPLSVEFYQTIKSDFGNYQTLSQLQCLRLI
jgi:hypothetical protein